ncbi:hypothetical protein JHW45_08305 [Paracoccus stylophorae]|uniref:Uncharacterized protein n=1 Tax=Paracoccus stylophorae TaxID=659350 RepID=A0ABY7SZJ6_9RHOB|nr:hypothetical protein [Paracoccus stylophorae]WCR12298.1 hypothetical protein JHW45_08305 [Paracoccus stylophorae]
MSCDASYERLMRLLSARGLEFLRQRIMDLPDPVPTGHDAVEALAQTARLAPVLSGLRGHRSPLEDIVRRRLSGQIIGDAADAVLTGRATGSQRRLVLAGGLVAGDDPLWRMAMLTLAEDGDLPIADRLAAGTHDPDVLGAAERLVATPVPAEAVNAARIDRFAGVLAQLYRLGAGRPRFADARSYGAAHANAMRFADWARRRKHVTAMAQMAFCLRLIDPGHDLSDLMSEMIGSQRPDGSFPAHAGFSTRDQRLEEAVKPTLVALAALHIVGWRGYSGVRAAMPDRPDRPLHRCRTLFAAAIRDRIEDWCAEYPLNDVLRIVAAMTRATGENWFMRCGLQGVAPAEDAVRVLAAEIFGDAHAASQARSTLVLTALPAAWRGDAQLRWLRGAAVVLKPPGPTMRQFPARTGDAAGFDAVCVDLLQCQPVAPDPDLRQAARRHARDAMMASRRPDDLTLTAAAAYLGRLSRMAQLFEPDTEMPKPAWPGVRTDPRPGLRRPA